MKIAFITMRARKTAHKISSKNLSESAIWGRVVHTGTVSRAPFTHGSLIMFLFIRPTVKQTFISYRTVIVSEELTVHSVSIPSETWLDLERMWVSINLWICWVRFVWFDRIKMDISKSDFLIYFFLLKCVIKRQDLWSTFNSTENITMNVFLLMLYAWEDSNLLLNSPSKFFMMYFNNFL